jgi:hypothetical protein
MWKETIVAEFEISLDGLRKTTTNLRIAGLRARTGIRDLLDTNPTSVPRPAVPKLCKAETEVPWPETQHLHPRNEVEVWFRAREDFKLW